MNIVYFVFQDISGIKLQMGVSGKGVTIFCGEHPDFTPLNNFPWSVKSTVLYWGIIIIVMLCRVRIAGVNFKGKQLQLEMVAPSVSIIRVHW